MTVSELPTGTRAGHVALVGRPNVGKSTLLNALVGEKLSIVTPRAQTTREQVLGILTRPDAQIIFVDTPGLLEPKYRLQRAMLETALSAIHDADVILLLLDATSPGALPPSDAMAELKKRSGKLLVAVNKVDAANETAEASLAEWSGRELGLEVLKVSAATGEGVEVLLASLVSRLPESPYLFPADDLAVQPVRFFVAELVRETIFEQYDEEVPYSTVVRIEEFREDRSPVYIRATVYVERDSQKPILLGKGGARIRELGSVSRYKIEQFVGQQVYLDLWVKVMAGWRNKASALRFLGYPVPEEEQDGAGSGGNRATEKRQSKRP